MILKIKWVANMNQKDDRIRYTMRHKKEDWLPVVKFIKERYGLNPSQYLMAMVKKDMDDKRGIVEYIAKHDLKQFHNK